MLLLKLNLKDTKVLLQKHGDDDYELYESACFCGVNEGSSFRGSADDILEHVQDLSDIRVIISQAIMLDRQNDFIDTLKDIMGVK